MECSGSQKWTYFSMLKSVLRQTHLSKLRLGQGGIDPGMWGLIEMKPHVSALTLQEDTRKAKTGTKAHITECKASLVHLCYPVPCTVPGFEPAPNKFLLNKSSLNDIRVLAELLIHSEVVYLILNFHCPALCPSRQPHLAMLPEGSTSTGHQEEAASATAPAHMGLEPGFLPLQPEAGAAPHYCWCLKALY